MNNNGVVNIEIGKDVIQPIVEAKIQAAIAAAFTDDPVPLINAICDQALNIKVDSDGKIGQYQSNQTFLSWYVKKTIRDEAEKALGKIMEEQRPKIQEAIKKKLLSQRGADRIAAAVVDGISESLKCKYTSHLNVTFQSPRER